MYIKDSQSNLSSPAIINPTYSNSTFQKGDAKKSILKPKKPETTSEDERKGNEAQSRSKMVSFQEEQNEQRQDDEDVDMEEPVLMQDEVKRPWEEASPKEESIGSLESGDGVCEEEPGCQRGEKGRRHQAG